SVRPTLVPYTTLFRSVAALGAGALARPAFAEAPPGAIEREVFPDPTKHQGVGVGVDDGGYGRRSQFETEVRWRYPTKTTESSWKSEEHTSELQSRENL